MADAFRIALCAWSLCVLCAASVCYVMAWIYALLSFDIRYVVFLGLFTAHISASAASHGMSLPRYATH